MPLAEAAARIIGVAKADGDLLRSARWARRVAARSLVPRASARSFVHFDAMVSISTKGIMDGDVLRDEEDQASAAASLPPQGAAVAAGYPVELELGLALLRGMAPVTGLTFSSMHDTGLDGEVASLAEVSDL